LKGSSYSRIFRAYLDAVESSGSISLLEPLLSSFRAGERHKHYDWITSSLVNLVKTLQINFSSNLDATDATRIRIIDGVTVLCNYCFSKIVDAEEHMEVKRLLFEHLCLPLLQQAPTDVFSELVCTRERNRSSLVLTVAGIDVKQEIICKLVSIIQKPPFHANASDSEAKNSLLLLQYSYILLETIYDRCPISTIKSQITVAFAGYFVRTFK
jgi:hypothetical protein